MRHKKRILFVDDEPNILTGLQRMLRKMRKEWDMVFVDSPEKALKELESDSYDVIVSDMKMPGMDGNQLLANVKEHFPEVIRLILSGRAEEKSSAESIGVTHQFLSKPCEADELKQTIDRCFWLKSKPENHRLKALISNISRLPSLPHTYHQITEALRSDDVSIKDIGKIIAKDISMSAKILQLVNSAFFGVRYTVSDPAQAVNYLGIKTIRTLVFSIGLFSQFDEKTMRKYDLVNLWTHSLDVGRLAKKIYLDQTGQEKKSGDGLMAGMLHDIGKLIIISNFPDEFGETREKSRNNGIPLYVAEIDVLGTSHAEVGSYLLGLWGLQQDTIEAIYYHHRPSKSGDESFSLVTAVHSANCIVQNDITSLLDVEYLETLGVHGLLAKWQELHQNEDD